MRSPQDDSSRWKLIGFYSAHNACCPELINERIKHVIWAVENKQEGSGVRGFLKLFPPAEPNLVDQIRDAWLKRLEVEPDNLELLKYLGDFLCTARPRDSRKYLERILELEPNDKLTRSKLERVLSPAKPTTVHKPAFCFFEIISSVPILLEEIRTRTTHTEKSWTEFVRLVTELAYNPMFLVCTQYSKHKPNRSAVDVCKHGLKAMYRTIPADNPTGKALRSPDLQHLWREAKVIK